MTNEPTEASYSPLKYEPEHIRKNVDLWLEALESGQYAQCEGKLESPDGGFCCLGVACKVLGIPRTEFNGDIFYGEDGQAEDASLPDYVRDMLGLTSAIGLYNNDNLDTLASHNDHGLTFEEIAAIIRSRPEGLFLEGVYSGDNTRT